MTNHTLHVTTEELECLHDYITHAKLRLAENADRARKEGFYERELALLDDIGHKIDELRGD